MKHSKKWTELIQFSWNNEAQKWTENSEHIWEKGSRKDILGFVQQYVEKDAHVLDIGCAGGYSTNKLKELGYTVAGVDIAPKMIDFAKQQYPGIDFYQGDVSHLGFSDTQFSAAIAINVLEWTESPIYALKEISRVVQPNGYVCIGILGPTAGPRQVSFNRLLDKNAVMNTMQPWEFQQLAEFLGFQLMDVLVVDKKWSSSIQGNLPMMARQALSFMTVFIMKNGGKSNETLG